MGLCYEKNPRFSGGVYNPFVRRLSELSDSPLEKALRRHEKIADMILELDEKVAAVVAKLKAKGFVSPYLKTFVVARSNPLRFMKEPPELEDLIKTIRGKVERFNVDKIKQEDIVASGGAADDSD
jgi:ParB family chromosome partitioning protein